MALGMAAAGLAVSTTAIDGSDPRGTLAFDAASGGGQVMALLRFHDLGERHHRAENVDEPLVGIAAIGLRHQGLVQNLRARHRLPSNVLRMRDL